MTKTNHTSKEHQEYHKSDFEFNKRNSLILMIKKYIQGEIIT